MGKEKFCIPSTTESSNDDPFKESIKEIASSLDDFALSKLLDVCSI
jgi:hypothetical protein